MENETKTFLRDVLRQTWLYPWLRRQPWVHQLRDVFRLAKLLGVSKAIKISQELWSKPGRIVEIVVPGVKHPLALRSCTSDSRVFCEIFGDKIYDCGPLENVKYVVDAGANIGVASVFFADRYPNAKIVAIEPSSSNMDILKKNIACYPGISAREAGIWPRKESLRFTNPDLEHWALRVETCEDGEASFATVTMPMIVQEFGMDRIDILKIDIEGAEGELLLKDDPSWLGLVQFLIIELHGEFARERFNEVNSVMEKYGLHLTRGGENCFFSRSKSPSASPLNR